MESKMSYNVQCSRFKELRSSTKERIKKIYPKIFGEEKDGGKVEICDHEIIFWIQDRTQIISFAILDPACPVELLNYNCFSSSSKNIEQDKKKEKVVTLLHSVGTDEKYRNKGCCSAIINAVIVHYIYLSSFKEEKEKEKIFLEVDISNEKAVNIYTKFGFKIFDREKNYHLMILDTIT